MGTDAPAIDHDQTPVQRVVVGGVLLQGPQHPVPDVRVSPAPKAGIGGLPGPIPLRQITPRSPGSQDPEDRVEDDAVLLGGTPGTRDLGRKQRGKPLPLGIGDFVASLWTHPPTIPPLCKQTLGAVVIRDDIGNQ